MDTSHYWPGIPSAPVNRTVPACHVRHGNIPSDTLKARTGPGRGDPCFGLGPGTYASECPLARQAACRVPGYDAVGWSGYITPTMSDGPIWVCMNRDSWPRTAMLVPRRT